MALQSVPVSQDESSPRLSSARPWAFIPTPGDHYSPATGSANISRTYHLAREHVAAGGQSIVIVGRGTRADTYDAGRIVRVDYPLPNHRWQKILDLLLGRATIGRRLAMRPYARAGAALGADFRGPIFVYNEPWACRILRQTCPQATLVLYLGNQVWRTYSSAEARAALASADHVICISHFLANDLRQSIPDCPAPIHVVHSGADLRTFSSRDRSQPVDGPVILYAGRIQPVKGPDLLVAAAKRLAEMGKRFRVRFVGSQNFNRADPLTRFEMDLHHSALSLGDRVEFQPFIDRRGIGDVFNRADILCVPSRWDEPLGMVVLEGMASGLPMVVARSGGIPEIAGRCALYFAPPDIEGLVNQLSLLIEDPNLRGEMGRLARAEAETMTWAIQYQKLRAVIEEQRRPPSGHAAPTTTDTLRQRPAMPIPAT